MSTPTRNINVALSLRDHAHLKSLVTSRKTTIKSLIPELIYGAAVADSQYALAPPAPEIQFGRRIFDLIEEIVVRVVSTNPEIVQKIICSGERNLIPQLRDLVLTLSSQPSTPDPPQLLDPVVVKPISPEIDPCVSAPQPLDIHVVKQDPDVVVPTSDTPEPVLVPTPETQDTPEFVVPSSDIPPWLTTSPIQPVPVPLPSLVPPSPCTYTPPDLSTLSDGHVVTLEGIAFLERFADFEAVIDVTSHPDLITRYAQDLTVVTSSPLLIRCAREMGAKLSLT